jgi:hypothetical protein
MGQAVKNTVAGSWSTAIDALAGDLTSWRTLANFIPGAASLKAAVDFSKNCL